MPPRKARTTAPYPIEYAERAGRNCRAPPASRRGRTRRTAPARATPAGSPGSAVVGSSQPPTRSASPLEYAPTEAYAGDLSALVVLVSSRTLHQQTLAAQHSRRRESFGPTHDHRHPDRRRPAAHRGERPVRAERTGAGLGPPRPARGAGAQGNRRRRDGPALAEDPQRFLPTVQVGITLVGMLTGVFGGARHRRATSRPGCNEVPRAAARRQRRCRWRRRRGGHDLPDHGVRRAGAEAARAAPPGESRRRRRRHRSPGWRGSPAGGLVAGQSSGLVLRLFGLHRCRAAGGDRGGAEGAARRGRAGRRAGNARSAT